MNIPVPEMGAKATLLVTQEDLLRVERKKKERANCNWYKCS